METKQQRVFREGKSMQLNVSNRCSHCHEMVKSKRRDFNNQTWTVLLLLGEVHQDSVDRPLCDDCYNELRDILIERAGEIDTAAAATPGNVVPQQKPAREAPAGKMKGRKISKIAG